MTIDESIQKCEQGCEDTLEDLAAWLKELKGERENKWISVRNKLPESYINVLFCDIDDDVMLGYHIPRAPETHFVEKGSWDTVKNVKAWMPLPSPYKPRERSEEK